MSQGTSPELTRRQLLQRLWRIGRPVIAPLGFSLLARILGLVFGIALLAVAAWGVGIVAIDRSANVLLPVFIAMVVIALVKGIARYLEHFAGHLVAFRALALLRNYFFQRLEPQAPAAVEGKRSGDLLSRVTKDVDRVEVFFAHTLVPAAAAVIVPVVTTGWLGLFISWWSVLALAPFLVVVGLIVPQAGRAKAEHGARTMRAGRGAVAQHVTDSVNGVREVLAFGAQRQRLDELERIDDEIGTGLDEVGLWVSVRRGVNSVLVGCAVAMQLVVLTPMVVDGSLDWVQLAVALAVALGSFAAVLAVEDFAADLDQALASARRIFTVTDSPPLVASPSHPRPVPTAAPRISLVSVGFAYPPGDDGARNELVLDDVSFDIPAGATVALVGASGSGKSTVASLLTRSWDVTSGAICVDGTDLREFELEKLRACVVVALQRPYLFNDTIAANLRLAQPSANDDELWEALELAGLSEFVMAEPTGLATPVGEMGERLSGGQQQRLALARMILRDAPVVVLDEVTSQLDLKTEADVLERMSGWLAERTVIVIAHRLTTIANADDIIVLDAGRVVEHGTHHDLVTANGPYSTLLKREREDLDVDATTSAGR